MKFTNFSKTEDGLQILLYNESAIENISTITHYSDNAAGTFDKKEFRWSFNNIYWSSWQTLSQSAISSIDLHGSFYLFLQIRYIQTTAGSGTVTSFILNYKQGDPRIVFSTPINSSTSSVYSSDDYDLYDYTQRSITSYITDACTLNGYNGNWYLNRSHHTGYQPISSITGLQAALNNFSNVTVDYVDGSLSKYLREASLNTSYFKWDSGLLEPSILGGSGDVTKADVDASLKLYVQKAGDTMSGNLIINSSLLNVDGIIRSTQTSTGYTVGYSEFIHANSNNQSSYPRTYFSIYGNASVANAGIYAVPGNTSPGVYKDIHWGISNNKNVKDPSSKQVVLYLSPYCVDLFSLTAENAGSKKIDWYLGGTWYRGANPTLTLSASSNVGIKTNNPRYTLDVSGSVNIDDSLNVIGSTYFGDSSMDVHKIKGKMSFNGDPCSNQYSLITFNTNSCEKTYAWSAINDGRIAAYLSMMDGGNLYVDRSAVFGSATGRVSFVDIGAGMVMNISRRNYTIPYDTHNFGIVLGSYNYKLDSSDGFYMNRYINNPSFGNTFFMGWGDPSRYGTPSNWPISIPRENNFIGINNFLPRTNLDISGNVYSSGNLTVNSSVLISLTDDATNNIKQLLYLKRSTTGTAANEFGAGISYWLQKGDGSSFEAVRLQAVGDNINVNNRAARFQLNISDVDGNLKEAFRIDDSGALGLGATPYTGAKLQVNGDIFLGPLNDAQISSNGQNFIFKPIDVPTFEISYQTLNAYNNRIQNLGYPINSSDAVNKSYVDESIANFATNTSVNLAFLTNPSLGSSVSLTNYINDSSLGSGFAWNAGLLDIDVSVVAGGVTKEYVDSSIANFATNASVNLAFLTNPSLGSSVSLTNYINDSSLNQSRFKWDSGLLEPSVAGGIGDVTKEYVDGSLSIKADLTYVDGSLALKTDFAYDIKQDASIGLKADLTYVDGSLALKTDFTYSVKQDASIGLKADLTYVDASLNAKTDFTYSVKQDASIGLKADQTYVDASITNFATNASVNLAFLTNPSLGSSVSLTNYINDSSLNQSTFKWIDGLLEPSVAGTSDVTKAYVDGSLALKTDFAYDIKQDASISLKADLTYVDGSIANFATNASVNLAFLTNASLGSLSQLTTALNSSLNNFVSKEYVDGSLSTKITSASNVGDGSAGIFKQISGTDLEFRKLTGSGAAVITEGTDVITISLDASFSGENNTASNLGSGVGLYSEKVGSDLEFKSLKSTNNTISFSSDASHVYLDVSINYYEKEYVDGSLALKADFTYDIKQDASIALKADQTYVDGSLALKTDFTYDIKQDASIGLKADLTYVDGSLALKTDFTYSVKQDASIGLKADLIYVDGSIANFATNASVNLAFLSNASLGSLSQLTYALNSSLGLKADQTYVDGSLALKTNFTYSVKQDASIGLKADQTYVDSSIVNFATNASVNLAFLTNSSLGLLSLSNTVYNSSIGILTSRLNITDSSLYDVDSSVKYLFKWDYQQDASIKILKDYWVDINRMGFIDRTDTSLLFDQSTYVFTLALNTPATQWEYFRSGIKYTINHDVSLQLSGTPPAAETYYIYIDDNVGTLAVNTVTWTLQDEKIPVVIIKFDASAYPNYQIQEERHEAEIDREMHWYLHLTRGTQLVSGAILDGPSLETASNAGVCYGISETVVADEDLREVLPELVRPNGNTPTYTIEYRTSSTKWTWTSDVSVPYLHAPGGYIYWDNSGTMTQGIASNYYNTYLILTSIVGQSRYIQIHGRGQFNSLIAAQAEDAKTFDFTGFGIAEAVIAYQFTWATSNSYSNLGKCRLAANPRKINVSTISTTTTGGAIEHDSLAGLQGGISGEYYHLSSEEYTQLGTALDSYATNASVNLAFLTNSSLGNLSQLTYALNSSLGLKADLTYVDGSIVNFATNASVNLAFLTNASLGVLTSKVNYIDACLGPVSNLTYILNTSVGNLNSSLGLFATNASVNLAFLTNASLGSLSQLTTALNSSLGLKADLTYVDGSLNVKTDFTYDVKQDASISLKADQTYVDGSLALKTDFTYSVKQDASIGLKADQTYVDGSLNVKTDFTYSVKQDASIGLKVDQTYVDGSLVIFATNASVNLAFLTNPSLGSSVSLTNYINDSSLNQSTFKWIDGLLEPSVAGSGTTSLSALTSDVSITDASNNHILQFDSSWNKWLNVAPVEFSEYFYTRSETDASFALITSINSFATNASVNLAFLTNPSLGSSTDLTNYINDSSLNESTFKWNAGLLEPSVATSGASVEYVDGSINDIRNTFVTNASVNLAFLTNPSLGSSTDLTNYINDSSLNSSTFKWNAGLLEPSVSGSGTTSLSALTSDVSIVDVSINNLLQYDSSWGKWKNVVPLDASTYFYSKSEIDSSFSYISNRLFINSSLGTNYITSGTFTNFSVMGDISFGDVVRITISGDVSLAKADISTNANAMAICVNTPSGIASGANGSFLLYGTVRYNNWSWTPGNLIYLSATGTKNNTLTQSAPAGTNNIIQILGVAIKTNTILFTPSFTQIEHT